MPFINSANSFAVADAAMSNYGVVPELGATDEELTIQTNAPIT